MSAGLGAVLGSMQKLAASSADKAKPLPWEKGPTSQRKSKSKPVTDLIPWVRAVEDAFQGDAEKYIVALRRLYYCKFLPGAGAKFDRLLDTPDANAAPITTDQIPQATLDALFETDLVIALGQSVDPSHIFVALDAAISGFSVKGNLGAFFTRSADLEGTVAWVGDLASWILEWNSRVRKKEKELKRELSDDEKFDIFKDPNLIKAKVDKDDLFGDMDGQILAKYWDRNTRLSDMLASYYGPATPVSGVHASRRFHLFPLAAKPQFRYEVIAEGPPEQVSISDETRTDISLQIDATLDLFLRALEDPPTTWRDHSKIEWDMRYTVGWAMGDFLQAGIQNGDPPWPPPAVIYHPKPVEETPH